MANCIQNGAQPGILDPFQHHTFSLSQIDKSCTNHLKGKHFKGLTVPIMEISVLFWLEVSKNVAHIC
jgi:hypothetical protein